MNCPNCQTPYEGDNRFCAVCGTARPQDVDATVAVVNEVPYAEPAYADAPAEAAVAPKKKSPVGLIIGLAAVAVVAVIVLAVIALGALGVFDAGGNANYQTYYDGTDLMLVNTKNGKTFTIVEGEGGSSGGSAFITIDGKTMFYQNPDGDLYFMSTAKPDKEHTKIASEVRCYSVSLDGKKVAYKKDDNLYYGTPEDTAKVSGDVDDFSLSTDGKYLVFEKVKDEKNDLYIAKNGKDAEKVASDVVEYDFFDESYKELVYVNSDGKLYVYDGKESAKIAEDVDSVTSYVTSKGEFYYTVSKAEEEEKTEEETVSDSYYDYGEEIATPEPEVKEFYFYDGKESVKITDKYYSGKGGCMTAKNPIAAYTTAVLKNDEVKYETFLTFGGADPVSLGEDIGSITFDEKGKKMLYSTSKTTGEGEDQKTKYCLYEAAVKSNGLGDIEELVTDSKEYIYGGYLGGDTLVYICEEEFVVKGETILSDYHTIVDITCDESTLLLAADAKKETVQEGDYSYEKVKSYSLYSYKLGSKKAEKVADDVSDAAFDGKKAICYIADDTLYVNGKKIADDITGVDYVSYADDYAEGMWAPSL